MLTRALQDRGDTEKLQSHLLDVDTYLDQLEVRNLCPSMGLVC